MGNLCGSPSKDRDYEDHNGLDRKGIRAEKINKVSLTTQTQPGNIQGENLPQAKMEIVDRKEKEFNTKNLEAQMTQADEEVHKIEELKHKQELERQEHERRAQEAAAVAAAEEAERQR